MRAELAISVNLFMESNVKNVICRHTVTAWWRIFFGDLLFHILCWSALRSHDQLRRIYLHFEHFMVAMFNNWPITLPYNSLPNCSIGWPFVYTYLLIIHTHTHTACMSNAVDYYESGDDDFFPRYIFSQQHNLHAASILMVQKQPFQLRVHFMRLRLLFCSISNLCLPIFVVPAAVPVMRITGKSAKYSYYLLNYRYCQGFSLFRNKLASTKHLNKPPGWNKLSENCLQFNYTGLCDNHYNYDAKIMCKSFSPPITSNIPSASV